MKSPEEWIIELDANETGVAICSASEIEQIQIDAMRRGAEKAANRIRLEIENCFCRSNRPSPCAACIAKEESRQLIIRAYKKWATKDLI